MSKIIRKELQPGLIMNIRIGLLQNDMNIAIRKMPQNKETDTKVLNKIGLEIKISISG